MPSANAGGLSQYETPTVAMTGNTNHQPAGQVAALARL